MPHFNVIRSTEIPKTYRTNRIMSDFDYQREEIKFNVKGEIDVDLNGDWNIGAIVGNSGTGKTVIAKEVFEDDYRFVDVGGFEWGDDPIIEEMPDDKSVKEIEKTFTAVGFSSPPSWLKPFSVLSQGEKMRANLAKALLLDDEIVVFDEFTSVVDRTVAKTMSLATKRAFEKVDFDKKIVVVTCHQDILDWLAPSWVFNTNKMETLKKKSGSDQSLSSLFESAPENYGRSLEDITI